MLWPPTSLASSYHAVVLRQKGVVVVENPSQKLYLFMIENMAYILFTPSTAEEVLKVVLLKLFILRI